MVTRDHSVPLMFAAVVPFDVCHKSGPALPQLSVFSDFTSSHSRVLLGRSKKTFSKYIDYGWIRNRVLRILGCWPPVDPSGRAIAYPVIFWFGTSFLPLTVHPQSTFSVLSTTFGLLFLSSFFPCGSAGLGARLRQTAD